MPRAIDLDALESANMKILDINNPPTKSIPYEKFPKMVYLHPRDKAKEHLHKTVNSPAELEAAQEQGWKLNPHIPVQPVQDLSEHFEAEPVKRGPGRPKADAA